MAGTARSDGLTLAAVEGHGVGRMLDELSRDLRAGTYRPGRLWEQYGKRRYYLHRWPSLRSMNRARQRVKDLTGRNRSGMEVEDVIYDLNLFLRGWGNDFRTGNATNTFVSLDRHVAWRLKRLLIKKRGRSLRAGQADHWTPDWFHDEGLHKLLGTIRYPKAA
jgi:RNA-directed DNA polymerase